MQTHAMRKVVHPSCGGETMLVSYRLTLDAFCKKIRCD
jgi:hypothetical protein